MTVAEILGTTFGGVTLLGGALGWTYSRIRSEATVRAEERAEMRAIKLAVDDHAKASSAATSAMREEIGSMRASLTETRTQVAVLTDRVDRVLKQSPPPPPMPTKHSER